jgi:hypothetical protein
MSKSDFHQKLSILNEITLSVKGRKSGKYIPRRVWFVHGGNVLYLLPNRGSDTQWYKNLIAGSILKIRVNGIEVSVRGKSITDRQGVDDVMDRFQFKYGQDFKKHYTNFDVAVKVRL